jgi:mono/diheme cytochrome c family protein
MRFDRPLLAACAAALIFTACGDAATTDTADTASAVPTPTVAQASPTPAATPDELEQARSDYNNFCVKCHKQEGTGGRVELDDGDTIKVPNLREHGRKDSDAHLAEYIRDGEGGMPSFKDRLDERRINGLVQFIRAEFHGRAAGGAATAPAAPAR